MPEVLTIASFPYALETIVVLALVAWSIPSK